MQSYSLENGRGMQVEVLDYGAIVRSLIVPDRHGRPADVVLGYDDASDYRDNPPYLGAVIGRYANRIAHGRFSLDGTEYPLARNQPPHHLHGGTRGFDAMTWNARRIPDPAGNAVELRHTSPDGDEGYPGRLDVRVRYTLTDRDELAVEYRATTDRPTHVNPTQHSYFNLAGHDAGDILDHVIELNADRFTPADDTLIPTGELQDVAGTPLDFRRPTRIGARIDADHPQLRFGAGYDHNYVLNGSPAGGTSAGTNGGSRAGRGGETSTGPTSVLAARVHEPTTGRQLEVWTTEPGVQVYTGNHLDVDGKDGAHYGPRTGLALETQHFPDSPNQPNFPSTVLRPGEIFHSRTVYAFSTRDA